MHHAQKSRRKRVEDIKVNVTQRMPKTRAYQSQPEFQQSILRNRYSIPHKGIEVYSGTWEIQELYSMSKPIHQFHRILKAHFSQKFLSGIHVVKRAMKLPFENLSDPEEERIKQTFHRISHDDHQDGNWIPKGEYTK